MNGHQIDAVYEPLETLQGLLECLCCISTEQDSPDPKSLSRTFFHLTSLSCDLKDAIDAMIDKEESEDPQAPSAPICIEKPKEG